MLRKEKHVTRIRTGVFVLCLAVLSLLFPGFSWSQSQPVEMMPLSDVSPGMRGYGLSVFHGTAIDTFSVEVLGIMKNIFYAKHDLILVRIGGPYVDKAGVIAGMSGSPVYIDGKLVGALAYSFGQLPKEPIGAITPIAQMLAIKTAAATDIQSPSRMGMHAPDPENGLFVSGNPAPDSFISSASSSPFLKPISVPLMFSGFDPNTVRLFEDKFRNRGLIPLLGGGGSTDEMTGTPVLDASTLAPGSSVGAQLVRGDMNIAATGTVTYRDGNTILAFGHPFLWTGALNVPMTKADVIAVLPDQASSTKMANVTEAVGAVLWDHTNGLYGELGRSARMIPMQVEFDAGAQLRKTYNFEVIMSNEWTPMLVNMTVANTILGMGRMGGERTIELDGRVSMRGYQDIVLRDLFSGQLSLPAVATNIMNVLNVVLDNPFVTPNIESISLTIRSTDDRRMADIEGVWFDKEEVKPGETLDLTVFLRPYRGDRIVEKVSIPIPLNATEGDLVVMVGAAFTLTQQEFRTTPQRFQPQEVGQLINLLNTRRTNNKVYIKLYRSDIGGIMKGTEMSALPPSVLSIMSSSRIDGSFTPVRESIIAQREIQTDYVVTGQSQGRLRVKR